MHRVSLRVVVLGSLAWALGAAACGGKAAPAAGPTKPTAAATPCDSVAAHLADLMAGQEDEMIGPEHHPVITRIFGERCAADSWAPATIACMRDADLAHFDACSQQLTEAQRDAVEQQFERDLKPLLEARWKATHPDDGDGKRDKVEGAAPAEDAVEDEAGDAPDDDATMSAPPPAPKPAPRRRPHKGAAPRPDDPCGGGA